MRKTILAVLCAAAAVLAAALLIKYDRDTHITIGSRRFSRSAEVIDLRDLGISAGEYTALQQELSDTTLLWELPFQGRTLPLDTTEITVSSLSEDDAAALDHLPGLLRVNAEDCTDYDALTFLRLRRPDCLVSYRIAPLDCSWDAEALTLKDNDGTSLRQYLPYLPLLKSVTFTGSLPQPEVLRNLEADYPGIRFFWNVTLGSLELDRHTPVLDLSGSEVSYEELAERLAWLPNLRQADLTGVPLSDEELIALADRYPGCFFLGQLTVAGRPFSTGSEEIDLSGVKLEGPEDVEWILPYFPKLKKVILSFCGIDDETMDALNRRHEDVSFVWTVQIGRTMRVRTDETVFAPVKYRKTVSTEDLYNLRYCTEMVCVDIGHMWVKNCDWAAFMPKLRFLVLGETFITDLSPLANCKELEFLELFTMPITDYSPLVECTGLRDLNLGRTYADPTPISKMTWLEHLWWAQADAIPGKPSNAAATMLPEALPNTQIKIRIKHPTASGWRFLPNYYAMRDLMGMGYLDQDGS